MRSTARKRLNKLTRGFRYERDFQAHILRLAKLNGWSVYHTYDSRKSSPGFPDLVLAHADRAHLIIAELKLSKAQSVLTPHQQAWLETLQAVAADKTKFDVFVWTPKDLPEIEKKLAKERG